MKAIDVITDIIKYLKGDLVKNITQRLPSFEESDVQWILTVPVIWNLTTRGFLQKAAIMAGISKHQLTLLLEPDAAALYCEQKEFEILRGKDGQRFLSRLPLNAKYLVVDLGGGTIDITVHRRGQGHLTYKDKALGLKWGGKKVNECFEEYFEKNFLPKIGLALTEIKEKHPDDYLYLMENFEQEKIQFTVDKMNKSEMIKVRLPGLLSRDKKKQLWIPSSTFRSFFDTSINGLVEKLNLLLQSDVNEMQDINLILVVGGFAESSIVISELKNKFSNFNIVVPEKPGLAVMHGAVLFGFLKDLEDNNENLKERKQRQGTERQANPLRYRSHSDAGKVKHFLSDIVGREVIKEMRKEQLNQLVGQFQDKISKLKKKHEERDKVIFTLPIELRDLYTDKYNKTLEDGLQKFNGDVSCKKDKLIITSPFFQKHFL
ncbi:unnamed protein product [Mytilus coruscus]|uniref:Uncharacterized protein n=1 Tax=Mytilus coruscus TaxID=42192 RepID=A0A6J8BWC2_MYTCO|nr:unnamed protein product [Mytilus coruscus]